MNKKKNKKSKRQQAIVYLVLIVVVLVLQATSVFSSVGQLAEDALFQTGIVQDNIYVIGIDEETMEEYGQFENWSRTKMAELINYLMSDPETAPAVIGIDIGYYYEKDTEIDAALVEAVKNAGNVVLIDTYEIKDTSGTINVAEGPFEELKKVAYSTGFSNFNLDDDGVLRHARGAIKYGAETKYSFATEVYKAYLESQGEEFTSESNGYFSTQEKFYYLVYTGAPYTYYGSVGAGCSFSRVLKGEYPKEDFKDAIVLIGAYASGTQDNYYTPIDKSQKMYGVEVHANAINQLMRGSYKYESNSYIDIIPTLLIGVICALLGIFLEPKYSISINVGITIFYPIFVKIMYEFGNVMLPLLEPTVIAFVITFALGLMTIITVSREKTKLMNKYTKFLSPSVAKRISETGEAELKLGGKKKDIAVLFVDIRSFTTLSENMDPEKIVQLLNRFFALTTKAIFDNDGTVDKYIGDNTMGFFNAPVEIEDYTYKAVLAGLYMVENCASVVENLPPELEGKVGFGVGIHVGEAVVGNVGTKERMDYTAIGDTVNVASRLEGQAKAGEVIVSQEVYERLKDRLVCEEPRTVHLKGKTADSLIYRVLSVR